MRAPILAATPSRTMRAIRASSEAEAGDSPAPRSSITYARTAPCGTCAATYSGKLSHSQRIPAERAVPGMSSTPSISSISQVWRSRRTGAKPTPQLPITTVVTPCHAEGAITGSQVACPS